MLPRRLVLAACALHVCCVGAWVAPISPLHRPHASPHVTLAVPTCPVRPQWKLSRKWRSACALMSIDRPQQRLEVQTDPPVVRLVPVPSAEADPKAEAAKVSIGGRRVPIKYIVLLLLVLQNSAVTLLVRHTRTPRLGGGPVYLGAMAVLVSELLKLPTCLALIARDEGGFGAMVRKVRRGVFGQWRDTLRMGVPAVCYGLQNALFFIALSNLSASSYQLWSQSKTLFTALFFVHLLGKTLGRHQWLALGLLTAGVGLVQLQEAAGAAAVAGGVAAVGVLAVLASSLLSGFANIYFEKVLKQADCEAGEDGCKVDGTGKLVRTPPSLWLRNVQLGLFAIPQAVAMLLVSSTARATIASHGVLVGFSPAVWLVTALTAGGGLLIAAVVKHADNLMKTYATAVSIVLTCAITTITTGVSPTPRFLQGMALVLSSIFLYNANPTRLPRPFRATQPAQ